MPGNCAPYRTWSDGDEYNGADASAAIITASTTNDTMQCLDDYSTNVTQMQTTTDPFPLGAESLATSGAGEIERLRFVIQRLTGWGAWYRHTDALQFVPRGFIDGLIMSRNSATSITVAAGAASDSTAAALMKLNSAMTKTTAGWTAGNNGGGLDAGVIAPSTWYHFFEIQRSDSGAVDVLFSISATTPTMPTNYDRKRRIGAALTNSSSQWVEFIQNGDTFLWLAPFGDISATDPGTNAVNRALTVPSNISVQALIDYHVAFTLATSVTQILYLSSLSQSDLVPNTTTAATVVGRGTGNTAFASGSGSFVTDTARQIRSRLSVSDSNTVLRILTKGWIDPRGRNA